MAAKLPSFDLFSTSFFQQVQQDQKNLVTQKQQEASNKTTNPPKPTPPSAPNTPHQQQQQQQQPKNPKAQNTPTTNTLASISSLYAPQSKQPTPKQPIPQSSNTPSQPKQQTSKPTQSQSLPKSSPQTTQPPKNTQPQKSSSIPDTDFLAFTPEPENEPDITQKKKDTPHKSKQKKPVVDENYEVHKRLNMLWKMAVASVTIDPIVSSHYISMLRKLAASSETEIPLSISSQYCMKCSAMLLPDVTCRVDVVPSALSKFNKRLFEENYQSTNEDNKLELNNEGEEVVPKKKKWDNCIKYTCNVCSHSNTFPGKLHIEDTQPKPKKQRTNTFVSVSIQEHNLVITKEKKQSITVEPLKAVEMKDFASLQKPKRKREKKNKQAKKDS